MTISTFAFLNGRTSTDDRLVRVAGRLPQHPGGVLQRVLRRFRPAGATSVQRDHHRRVETDAYLDRGGLSSVDWLDAIVHHAQR